MCSACFEGKDTIALCSICAITEKYSLNITNTTASPSQKIAPTDDEKTKSERHISCFQKKFVHLQIYKSNNLIKLKL